MTGSTRETSTEGYTYATEENVELDPQGRDAGGSDPYAAEAELGTVDYSGTYEIAGNGFDGGGHGCEWDGMPIKCEVLGFVRRTREVVGIGVRRQGHEGGGFGMEWGLSRVWHNGGVNSQAFDDEGEPLGPPSAVTADRGFFWVLNGSGFSSQTSTPQEPDTRTNFRDYAEQLSNNTALFDCHKLVLMMSKAAKLWGNDRDAVYGLLNGLTELSGILGGNSDRNYRVGVLARDPHYARSFGDSGFRGDYQGYGFRDGSNQVRHFIGWYAAGNLVGGRIATNQLYEVEGTNSLTNPDVALGVIAIELGSTLGFGNTIEGQLASIWRNVCGEKWSNVSDVIRGY